MSNAKILLEAEQTIKIDGPSGKMRNGIFGTQKKIMSARRDNNKSPLDVVDYTSLQKANDKPNFQKFMNVSSSQQLKLAQDGEQEIPNDIKVDNN